jgi:1-deoxy-D-xylulose-5-phosphate synthase
VSRYLSRIKLSSGWRRSKRRYDSDISRIPRIGPTLLEWSRRLRHAVVDLSQPGRLFEDLGVTYIGPIPGHDLVALDSTIRQALDADEGPILVHVRTRKGYGYRPAEADKVSFHGAALPPMTARAGNGEAADGEARPAASEQARTRPPNYTKVLAAELVRIGEEDDRVVGITAGMPTGTGISTFAERFPERTYDVGIAEQHAMAMATGLALAGQRPFIALYSTFLQRAFDQVIHDVCQNDAPVVIGIDRAGLVGEDGTSHQGMFTLSALRQVPNLVLAAPRDEQELRRLLRTAFAQEHPFALQYPRDPGFGLPDVEPTPLEVGRGELLREGHDIVIVGLGPILARGMAVAEGLAAEGWSVGVIDARFARPIDRELIIEHARDARLVVTLEESVLPGGFGAAVLEVLADAGAVPLPLKRIGLPDGRFVDHGSVSDLRALVRVDEAGIREQIDEAIADRGLSPARPATVEA